MTPFQVIQRPPALRTMPVHVLNLARTNTDNLGFANSQLGEVDGHLAANLVDENTAATVVEQSNLLTDSTDLNIRQAAEGGPIVAAQTTKKYSTELINSEPQRAAIIDKFAYTTGLAHTSLYYLTDQGSTQAPPPVVPIPPGVLQNTTASGGVGAPIVPRPKPDGGVGGPSGPALATWSAEQRARIGLQPPPPSGA